MGYFRRIFEVSKSILIGMNVTLKHMLTPSTVTTRQYMGLRKPKEGLINKTLGLTEGYDTDEELEPQRYYRSGPFMDPVKPLDYLPQRHRGLHYLESEKCIMCFQCSRACPVDCIDIEGTRDGNIDGAFRADRVILTRFTIDYSLCIFCDHCTLACPDKQKCIIMGKEFDMSSYNQEGLVKNLLTDKPFSKEDRDWVLEARREIDRYAEEKAAAKAAAKAKKAAARKAKAAKAAAAKKAGGDDKAAAKKPAAKKPAAKKAEDKAADKAEAKAEDKKAEDKKPESKAEAPKAESKAEDKKAEAESKAEDKKADDKKAEAKDSESSKDDEGKKGD